MTEQAGARRWQAAAWLWLAVVLAVAAHQWSFWREGRLNTDVMALLPQDEQAPEVAAATRRLAERTGSQIAVLVGAPDWPSARRAALAYRNALDQAKAPLHAGAQARLEPEALLAFYRPWRDRLLTAAQRRQLDGAGEAALVQSALAGLYQPGAGQHLSSWAADPLGLWQPWLTERAALSRARPRDGELWVASEGLEWVALAYEIEGSPFALNGDARYGPALQAAEKAALQAVPGARVVAAGLPLHAEAAAVQASREINTIGWGSLAAVLLLVWLAFRSLRPIALVACSLAVGVAAALSVTAWVFGEVHLLTLVFGASLVGVAEDYGIHYFASRQGQPGVPPRTLMRQLLPGLALALGTSVAAYLVLGLAPFPGLRQMALFSATGLLAAFLTVVCWFPRLDGGAVAPTRFATAVGASLQRWPRFRWTRTTAVAAAAALLLCLAGGLQLRTADDLRQLQSSPAPLVKAQIELGRLLGLPGVAQFYLVSGNGTQQVLQREEALKARLDTLVGAGHLAGYVALSDWIPSLAQQQADAARTARAESQAIAGVNAALGESLARPVFEATAPTVQQWLAHPVFAPLGGLWLGEEGGRAATVVMLRGLHERAQLPPLQALADGLEGVRWVDKAGEASSLLERYRRSMTLLLLAGHAAVLAALWLRYRRDAWRAWLPTALASAACVALLGGLGQPFQLFNVLALTLLLGIGVDYGIFLLEHPSDASAWLAVVLGAGSTWLSFGLLALSGTPALATFGATLLVGIGLVWFLSPICRLRPLDKEN